MEEYYLEEYKKVLFNIGIAATYSGMYDHAKIIHDAGILVASDTQSIILGILQNETMQENYDEALFEIEKWEQKNESFAFLTWWKALILKVAGRESEAIALTYKIRKQGREDLAEVILQLRVPNR